jgi:hypothetical protein
MEAFIAGCREVGRRENGGDTIRQAREVRKDANDGHRSFHEEIFMKPEAGSRRPACGYSPTMRSTLLVLAAFPLLTHRAAAQLTTSPAANPVGTWRGSSVCVSRTPSCTDEVIVYRIVQKGARDSLLVDARKIVDGREMNTGSFACQLNAARAYITCVVPEGKWRLRTRRDSLVGQLRLHDGTWLLDVHAVRSGTDSSFTSAESPALGRHVRRPR